MNNIKKDTTEDKILTAAQTVFIQKGMDGARMQEIADEACINKALLHYYFRTKEKLFGAIFKKVFMQIVPNLMSLVESELPIEDKLTIFIDSYIDLLIQNPFLPTFILKEMNRAPELISSMLKNTGVNPEKIFAMFEKEMDAGRIRRMNPRDLLINILSMSIFPIAARPLMSNLFFNNNKKAYDEFIISRKVSVKEFILNSIML